MREPFVTVFHPDTFREHFEEFRAMDRHGATSPFEHAPGTLYRHNGEAGYAIRPDGELVYVHATARGYGDAIVSDAIANGAKRLDCFDGYLVTLYARHGFRVTDRVPNWTPGGPDVVFMSL